ncbi:MAG TPA: FtsQ-type POTRA domain-containing protein [Actinomycetota bacterium]|nr:FtsQ-type POTRA domain-containing protein [Actinomycetota bacterium]
MVLTVTVLGGLVGGGVALTRSSLFALDGIEIAGVKMLSRAEVLEASGLRIGQNVLSVDAGRVESRVEDLPIVANASVERLYPSKVRIRVRERTPAAAAVVGGATWLIEASGRLIAPVAVPPAGMPRVTVRAEPGSPALEAALRLWSSLPDWARDKTTDLEAPEPEAIAARIGGTRIIFGDAESVLPKMQAVVAIFERAKTDGKRVKQIDVRAPHRPAAVFA